MNSAQTAEDYGLTAIVKGYDFIIWDTSALTAINWCSKNPFDLTPEKNNDYVSFLITLFKQME